MVQLSENNLTDGWATFSISPLNFWDWQEQNRSTGAHGGLSAELANYTGGDRPETFVPTGSRRISCRSSEGSRSGDEESPGRICDPDGEPVVVLTHGFWQRAFAGDPEILGRTMLLDGAATPSSGSSQRTGAAGPDAEPTSSFP